MKFWYQFSALALCLALLISCIGCSQNSGDSTAPVTTLPMQEASAIYTDASAVIHSAPNLQLTLSYSESRCVGGQLFTEERSGSAVYLYRDTGTPVAQIFESLTYGSYTAEYQQYYIAGTAHCQINNEGFHTEMDFDSFLAYQLPSVLLDASLYRSCSMQSSDTQTVLTFSDPIALEAWAAETDRAQLMSAGGTAILDPTGTLVSTSYQAQYLQGTVLYTLEVTVNVTASDSPKLEAMEYVSGSTEIDCFDAPRTLLQVVGDVYTAEAISTSLSETISCKAVTVDRYQQVDINTWGSGDDFMSQADYSISITDYSNTAALYTQTETFRDGVYTSTVNGGSAVTQPGITAQQMRIYCEDTALASLMTPEYLSDAQREDLGDFYLLTFTGNDTFAEEMFSQVYSLISVNLDIYAPNYSTESAEGYLAINKDTGLPTSAGLYLSRTHRIDTVPYTTVYQLDQSLTLSSSTAYEAITGEPEPAETEPEETATPLFYKVTGENGQTLWLLGTIHAGDERTGHLPQAIYDAFHASDALAVEYNIATFEIQASADSTLRSQLIDAYYYTDGTSISDHISPELYEQASKLMTVQGLHSAATLKAFVWSNLIEAFLLEQDYSLTIDQGVDRQLIALAQSCGKPVLEIESGLSQVQMYADFSDDLQAALLADVVSASMLERNEATRQLYEFWCQGDEAALTQAVQTDLSGLTEDDRLLYEEYEKALLTDRNALMLSTAIGYLEGDQTVFYAVGLSHVLGEDGLVNVLKNAGYTVEVVTYE